MRTITRHIPAKTTTSYKCSRCKTKYRSAKKALECNAMPIESKLFKVGETVIWRGSWRCKRNPNKAYRIKARIVKIDGPMRVSEEQFRLLGGRFKDIHAYQYELNWNCPKCREIHGTLCFSHEFQKIKTR